VLQQFAVFLAFPRYFRQMLDEHRPPWV